MTFFEATITTTMLRFFLMMAIVIFSLSTGLIWLTFISIPIFLSALLGVSFDGKHHNQ